jgi:hypothetical protein
MLADASPTHSMPLFAGKGTARVILFEDNQDSVTVSIERE